MAGKLRACVDCGNQLSVTATGCGKCNSTDPFGKKRADQKAQLVLLLAGATIVACVAGYMYFTGTSLPALLRGLVALVKGAGHN